MPITRPTQTVRHTAVVLAGAASLTLTVVAGSYIVHQLPNATEAENHIVDLSAPPAPIQRADRAVDHAGRGQQVLPISPVVTAQGDSKTEFTSAFNSTSRWQSTAAAAGAGAQQRPHDSSDRVVSTVAGVAAPLPAANPAPGAAEPPNTFQPPDVAHVTNTPDQPDLDGTDSAPDEPASTPEGAQQGGRWNLGPAYLDARMVPSEDDTVAVTVGTNATNQADGANASPATQLQGQLDTEDPAASVRFSDPALGEHAVDFGGDHTEGNTAVPADNATDTMPQGGVAARGAYEPAEAAAQRSDSLRA